MAFGKKKTRRNHIETESNLGLYPIYCPQGQPLLSKLQAALSGLGELQFCRLYTQASRHNRFVHASSR